MKEFIATNNIVLVDDEDYDRVIKEKGWKTNPSKAVHKSILHYSDGPYKVEQHLALASFIMNRPYVMFDHIDRNPLNNQKYNLRECTEQQNTFNQGKRKGYQTSQYKGVSWNKRHKRFYAFIRIDGRRIYLGNFKDEVSAAKAYNKAAAEFFKEFAYLNPV